MKTNLILPTLFLLLIACNTSQQEDRTTDTPEVQNETGTERLALGESLEPIWIYDNNEETQKFELKQVRRVNSQTLTGETLEKIINTAWPNVQIKFLRTSNDTAFLAIPDSRVMTQQMGSAGAKAFMISTTYTFTELKGISNVSFEFEEGDHARPGVYNRNSWDEDDN